MINNDLLTPSDHLQGIQELIRSGETANLEHWGDGKFTVGSFRPITGKPAFKIDVNEFVSGQEFHGYRHLTLNNMVQDPSMLAEHGSYMLFARMNTPAPRQAT